MIKEIVQILMALITRVEKHCPLATDTLNTVQRVFFKFMCACVCVHAYELNHQPCKIYLLIY